MPQPTARCVYVRSSNLCVPLLPGNQHTERLHDFVHEGQRIWLPVDMGLLANAVRSRCNTCRQSLWRLQLSATTSTSREISAFCGRWNNQLGPARSLPLTMTTNERSCKVVMPLTGTEQLAHSTHCCIDPPDHPAIADDLCRAGHLRFSGPGEQALAAGERSRSIPRRYQCRQARVWTTTVASERIGSHDAHCSTAKRRLLAILVK